MHEEGEDGWVEGVALSDLEEAERWDALARWRVSWRSTAFEVVRTW